ncbi:MAG: glycoside hydrolase family 127 protein [Planctomycetia bacterium]|nr:glycoside hydrolase family 127 protein [Planctomycetia bacterium]
MRKPLRAFFCAVLLGTVSVIGAVSATSPVSAAEHEYNITPVPFTQVKVPDGFWKPRLDAVQLETIPFSFRKCEETGRISNFAKAGGLEEGKFQGIFFDDSDVYKVIEGAAYVLALKHDAEKNVELDKYLDGVIAKIAAAQEPDGYLYTSRTIYQKAKNKEGQYLPPGGEKRWTNTGGHELYCVGHLYEAAYAHYLATGKRNLLDVALKSADHICATFGVGKSQNWPPGHQEIEIGLAKLYRLTGKKEYLDTAKYFLDIRGKNEGRTYGIYGEYSQDHLPVLEQKEAVGHSVRACYMYTGMADVAALTGDKAYSDAILTIWKDVLERKLYVTGGVGSVPSHEAFGPAFYLPNDTAYCETCAQIATIFWAQRMFLDSGKGEYFDVIDKILYNAMLSGINLEGNRFFYPNVLEVPVGGRERSPWFGCSCCPSNLCRFLASMPGYIYAVKNDAIYVNLFTNSKTELDAEVGGKSAKVTLTQKTNYPWDGKVTVTTETEGRYTLKIRVPDWARAEAVPGENKLYTFIGQNAPNWKIAVNGENIGTSDSGTKLDEGYLTITRDWKAGDAVQLDFPMSVKRVIADERVEADRGKVALQRGPIIFCVEQEDVDTESIFSLLLADETELTAKWEPELLGGVMTLCGEATEFAEKKDSEKGDWTARTVKFRAIPYYAWAHRRADQMTVWLARTREAVRPLSMMNNVKIAVPDFVQTPNYMKDGTIPPNEQERNHPRMHWWPQLGASLWMEYRFPEETEVSAVEIYWFDDRDYGACRVPESWRLLYRDTDGNWLPVQNPSGYGTELYKFNRTTFTPVKTSALRVEIQSQEKWAGGVYEWKVE